MPKLERIQTLVQFLFSYFGILFWQTVYIIGLGVSGALGLAQLSATSFIVSAQGDNGVGIQSVSFGEVTEPSAAILASLGAFAFVLRCRR